MDDNWEKKSYEIWEISIGKFVLRLMYGTDSSNSWLATCMELSGGIRFEARDLEEAKRFAIKGTLDQISKALMTVTDLYEAEHILERLSLEDAERGKEVITGEGRKEIRGVAGTTVQ